MDDTAQTNVTTPTVNPPVQQPVAQASVPSAPAPQPVQDQLPAQPVGRHPEHAPVAPAVETSTVGPDTVSDASDVADSASLSTADVQQTPEVIVKESQPAVEVSQELQDVGVEQGEDAKQDRPEEQQKVDVALPKEQPQQAAPVVGAQPLPMDYQQALTTQKTSKIRDSIKWLATLVRYQWEQLQAKGENT